MLNIMTFMLLKFIFNDVVFIKGVLYPILFRNNIYIFDSDLVGLMQLFIM